jgi:hypothetical protein
MVELNLRLVTIIVVITFTIFQIIVLSLDIAILHKISTALSIASSELNSPLALSSVATAIYVFIGLSFGPLIVAVIAFKDKGNSSYFCFIVYSIIYIVRDGLVVKKFSCFYYFNNDIVLARASLSIISAVLLIAIVAILNYNEKVSFDDNESKIRIITSVILALVCVTMLTTNSIILNNIQDELKIDIGPSNIDIGFFNTSEFSSIQTGSYKKDSLFDYRLVTKLSDILFSKQKTLARRICTRNSCTDYYLRFLSIEIDCTTNAQQLFDDCQQASRLAFTFRYLDGGSYPTYNRARKSANGSCSLGCLNSNNNQASLVQQVNNNIELAWNGFCNCNKKQPNVILKINQGVNPCESNSNINKSNVYFYIFVYLLLNLK